MEIKDLKTKIITALGDIDLSKLTLMELQTYVNLVNTTENLAKEPDPDFYNMYSKLLDSFNNCAGFKAPTLSEMKGE
jgi:hypothetical protein